MTCDIWETYYNSESWEPDFVTIIMSDKVCTRFPSPCHTVTQTVHVTLLHGHGHGHR